MADEKTTDTNETKLSSKLEKIAKEIEGLTALELSDLASHLEDVFGVSAMPAVAAAPVAGAAADGEAAGEEQSSFTVVLADAGSNKLAVIKAVREVQPELGLMDAKKLVESAPTNILENAKKEDADAAKAKVEEAGGKVELK